MTAPWQFDPLSPCLRQHTPAPALGRWSCRFVTTQGAADGPCPCHPHQGTGHHLPTQLFASTLLHLFVMETNPATNPTCPLTSSMASAADDGSLSALTYTRLKETKNGSFDQPAGQGQVQPVGLSPRVSEQCHDIALLQVWCFQQRRERQGTQFTQLKNTTWPREGFCPSRITFSYV